jgi:hypothetical protein
MTRVTPQMMVDLIKTFPQEERDLAERDLTILMRPPYPNINCKLQCRSLPEPIGLLEYALRFGSPASVALLLNAGTDPNLGTPRPLTVLAMAQACRDAGRIEKLEALLRASARADYVETAEHVPPTPLIALARSKAGGVQRYWIARSLRAAGASAHTANDYELRVVARLLAELRAVDGIMQCLPPEEQAATRATPSSWTGLVGAVLRSENPSALSQMIMVKNELRLALDFDATAALLDLTARIADRPVTPAQAERVRLLLAAGADAQAPEGGDSAFERSLGYENHELVEIFLEAGAKPDLASAPEMVAELMRRQGLPQLPKARPAASEPPRKALTSLDQLCSGIDGLEACPESDLDRLTTDHTAAMESLAKRLHAIANRLAPIADTLPRR